MAKLKDYIPKFNTLHAEVAKYIRQHQGKRGYIPTYTYLNDKKIYEITTIIFDEELQYGTERYITKVSATDDDDILIWVQDIDGTETETWRNLEIVYCYEQTLINLANNLEDVVREQKVTKIKTEIDNEDINDALKILANRGMSEAEAKKTLKELTSTLLKTEIEIS